MINTFGSLSGTSTALRKYTKELYSKILPEELSEDVGFLPVGFIELASDNHRLEYYRRVARFNRLCGIDVKEISPESVKQKFPLVDTSDVLSGFYVEDDGRVNPYDVTMAMAKGSKLKGVEIYQNVSVKGVKTSNPDKIIRDNNGIIPKVEGVVAETISKDGKVNTHEIDCKIVVNCAGMWARQLGQLSGVNIPNQACEHYYLITDKISNPSPVDPSWPVVEDSSRCLYVRPEGEGLMLGLFEREGADWNTESIPHDFSFGEIEPDWDRMGDYLYNAMERVPSTLDTGAKKFFCGPESFTPDGNPIVGEAPEIKNYYVAAGMNSIGILTGGGIGKLMAEWILQEHPPTEYDLTGININRFQKYQSNQVYRKFRSREVLGETYKLHYPDHYYKSCRNIKKSPFHSNLKEKQNAKFCDISGFESPLYYNDDDSLLIGKDDIIPEDNERSIAMKTFGKPHYFSNWEKEHLACRNSVALFDMSFMSKFLVQGQDSGRFLNSLSTANIEYGGVDGQDQFITYTQWLNEQGTMEADLTISRLSQDQFLVVATDTMHTHVLTHMRKHLKPTDNVHITDVTGAYAQLNIQGPKSRELLQSIVPPSAISFDNKDFPFRSVAEIEMGYARLICGRITYVGELGYEIFIPVEFASHVYEDCIMKGNENVIQHAGIKALGSLRMEKGYRDYGHDMDNTDTLLECGLGFTCDFEKEGGFLGMEKVLEQKKQRKADGGLKKRLVQVFVPGDDMLHHGEVLMNGGKMISEIRSSSYGHSLGGSVGLTMLEIPQGCPDQVVNKEYIKNGDWNIYSGGEYKPCVVSLSPLYDPKSLNIKM